MFPKIFKPRKSVYLMQKILTKEKKAKKAKRNQLIIGIILIGVMVISSLGFALTSKQDKNNPDKLSYNGIEFIRDNSGYWLFSIQGANFATTYNPNETKDISFFSYLSINDYTSQPLFFVEEAQDSGLEIKRNLFSLVLRMQNACIDSLNCTGDFPAKNCSADNIIVIREPSDKIEKITQEEKCIFINAMFQNQTLYTDAFLFKILGIQ